MGFLFAVQNRFLFFHFALVFKVRNGKYDPLLKQKGNKGLRIQTCQALIVRSWLTVRHNVSAKSEPNQPKFPFGISPTACFDMEFVLRSIFYYPTLNINVVIPIK